MCLYYYVSMYVGSYLLHSDAANSQLDDQRAMYVGSYLRGTMERMLGALGRRGTVCASL